MIQLGERPLYMGNLKASILSSAEKDDANIFILLPTDNIDRYYLSVVNRNQKVISADGNDENLAYSDQNSTYSDEKDDNFKKMFGFVYTDSGFLNIVNKNGKCVDYDDENKTFSMKKCEQNNNNQHFRKVYVAFNENMERKSKLRVPKEKFKKLLELVSKYPEGRKELNIKFV
ncbi:hypothetical protein DMUE_0689 [Dictyocoela muelleri]|nr:hypothetical protein DMUE_0689 [Dictyocoela muelleri]